MVQIPALIRDLCFILIVAAPVSLLFKRLKQPIVLGYLTAGFLVSSHIPWMPTVYESSGLAVWSEIGVIFLLFGLGLEFSFNKLKEVGKSAIIVGLSEVSVMLGVGFLTGRLLGWGNITSIFAGALLAFSSTSILLKAFEELNLKAKGFVTQVLGVLVVEDLLAILLLVVLSTVGASKLLSGIDFLLVLLKLCFFLIFSIVAGTYIIPLILKQARSLISPETLLIFALAICLIMVLFSSYVGYSASLGAFIAGSVLGGTDRVREIELVFSPVKDLFSAVFFVSVGMLIDPAIVVQQYKIIILFCVLVVTVKPAAAAIGALLSGTSLKNSVRIGMSLSQIGEFSFLIASTGVAMKVLNETLYPIAVAVCAVTAFTTPLMLNHADRVYSWINRKIPTNISERLQNYQKEILTQETWWPLIWRSYGQRMLLNSVLIVGLTFLMSNVVRPFIKKTMSVPHLNTALLILTLLMAAPFFWPILFGRVKKKMVSTFSEVSTLKVLQIGLVVFKIFVTFSLLSFIAAKFSSVKAASFLIIGGLGVTMILLSRFSEKFYLSLEDQFLKNISGNGQHDIQHSNLAPMQVNSSRFEMQSSNSIENQSLSLPWEVNLNHYRVGADSQLVGKTVADSGLRKKVGVSIVAIERGKRRITAPGPQEIFMPNDQLFLLGEEREIELAFDFLNSFDQDRHVEKEILSFGLESFLIDLSHPLHLKKIKESEVRQLVEGYIIGIERGGARFLNPPPDFTMLAGDLMWVVGPTKMLHRFKTNSSLWQAPIISTNIDGLS